MLRMLARRTFSVQCSAAVDIVFAGLNLPGGSVVHDISLKLGYHSVTPHITPPPTAVPPGTLS